MADGRYHHGDLRAALLTQAEETLRVSGVDGLSLRELARAVGVSHGAPRRHFEDKAALLEALVAEGFHRLGCTLATAAEPDDREFVAVLKDVGIAYVRFASENPALVDLMSGQEFRPGIIALVTPDGQARQVADGIAFPNGMAVSPDN